MATAASRKDAKELVLDRFILLDPRSPDVSGGAQVLRPPTQERRPYGQKIETAQRRQRSNIFGLGPVLHNKLAVDA